MPSKDKDEAMLSFYKQVTDSILSLTSKVSELTIRMNDMKLEIDDCITQLNNIAEEPLTESELNMFKTAQERSANGKSKANGSGSN